ncbi:hypothetical protein B0T18DRAFT_388262 [Schizothecium vesticola]|uniref:Uncharacterized protein n=1 Tax=Schizothecium vesticola TaxID=314040 RepID=A0AA40F6U7_9PEZI|nr:hypothetical protein B0T18DRAFT_388262 [Schizothecium vesticola]
MPLPPITPAPSRFLVPAKRPGSEHPQGQTLNPQPSTGSHRFHATPRFPSGTTSLPVDQISTEPFSPAAPPIPVRSAKASRGKSTHDIIDEATSPVSSHHTPATSSTASRFHLPESIEFASSYLSQTPVKEQDSFIHHVSPTRSPKRRRISIASSASSMELTQAAPDQEQIDITISSPPLPPHLDSAEELPNDDPILPDNTQIYSSSPLAPAPTIDVDDDLDDLDDGVDYRDAILPHNTQILSSSPPPSYSDDDEDETHSPNPDEMITSSFHSSHSGIYPASYPSSSSSPQNQPTFHPAPRFGGGAPPTEPGTPTPHAPDDVDVQPAPDIFSPHRARNPRSRGHVAGGMAAELRDWLVEIKENEVESSNGATPALGMVRLAVDEIRRDAPPGMTLVAGRVGGVRVRAILAGDGDGGTVEEGAVVAISMPAWDVELEESWAVAYRWEDVGWEEVGGGKGGGS